jgi:selenocysteine lyase/cysteine desulfurase
MEVGKVCRVKGVKVALNCSQGIGAIPFDVQAGYADALTCVGFKWLCGPYGTGFCWIEPELRESLSYNQAYWLAMQTADDLKGVQEMPVLRDDLGARKYDVFGTANFFNLKPWTEAVNLLSEIGIDNVWAYDQSLIQKLIDGLDPGSYEIISPADPIERSNILIVSHQDEAKNQLLYDKLLKQQVFISLRNGRLRFSPHIFNKPEDIDRALAIMNSQAGRNERQDSHE